MPSINLRLTEEQHAELERWALDGHRSLQKEIIFRLFSEYVPIPLRVTPEVKHQIDALPPRDADAHFKPDFKK